MELERATVRGVTIDGPGSRDLDDAIWLESEPAGYRLTVSIADVADGVPVGSPLDERSRRRCFTRYFAGGNDPMLPPALSEDAMSLRQNKPRKTMSISVLMHEETLQWLEPPEVFASTLTSKRRFTYSEADAVAKGQKSEFRSMLSHAAQLAERLLAQRRSAGALAIYDLNRRWRTTEEGVLVPVEEGQAHLSCIIVQEFMILANQAVAAWCRERELPVSYRNHTAEVVRDDLLLSLAKAASLSEQPASWTLYKAVAADANVKLHRATYGVECVGHFGLNLPAYVHATSPIRRRPDLLLWRQVRAHLMNEPLAYDQISLEAELTHVNTHEEKRRAKVRNRYYEEAMTKAAAMSAEESVLHTLNPNEFYRVLKAVCRQGALTPAVAGEIKARVAADTLMARDAGCILFETAPSPDADAEAVREDINAAVVAWLGDKGAIHVPGILNNARQSLGFGPLLFSQDKQHGAPNARTYESQARMQIVQGQSRQTVQSGWHTAANKKLSRRAATADLLVRIVATYKPLGREIHAPNVKADDPIRRARPLPRGLPMVQAGNFVGALQEYASQQQLPPPVFNLYAEQTADRAVVTCEAEGFDLPPVRCQAGDKAQAKRAAAQLLYEALGARLEGREPAKSPAPVSETATELPTAAGETATTAENPAETAPAG